MSMLGQHSLSQSQALEWIKPRWREMLRSMPDAKRTETIDRAVRLASEKPQSYLADHLETLYGVKRLWTT